MVVIFILFFLLSSLYYFTFLVLFPSECEVTFVGAKGPAKMWEKVLSSLGVAGIAGSEPGFQGEEIAPLAKENVATP